MGFWSRLENTDAYPGKEIRLKRDITPQQSALMLEELIPQIPDCSRQKAESNEG